MLASSGTVRSDDRWSAARSSPALLVVHGDACEEALWLGAAGARALSVELRPRATLERRSERAGRARGLQSLHLLRSLRSRRRRTPCRISRGLSGNHGARRCIVAEPA